MLKFAGSFHSAGTAFCEIRSFLRSSIGVSVWRVLFLGCWRRCMGVAGAGEARRKVCVGVDGG